MAVLCCQGIFIRAGFEGMKSHSPFFDLQIIVQFKRDNNVHTQVYGIMEVHKVLFGSEWVTW